MITCLAVFLLHHGPAAWLAGLDDGPCVAARPAGARRPDVRPARDAEPALPVDLPGMICRWDRYPALAWLLPLVQLAWVNSHGLFVLGPLMLVFALVDAALRRGALAAERIRWWQTVVPACVATGLACLVNPYGLRGAIYPLELAGTMSNPIFSHSIAELTPIPLFIEQVGVGEHAASASPGDDGCWGP